MKKILGIMVFLLSVLTNAEADLNLVRELVIAPKNGRVLANIGSVNQSFNIRMAKARVDIRIDEVPMGEEPVPINVHAVFTLENESPETLVLTAGFPVSNSEYSAFSFKSFQVEADGEPRSVFNRISGYPWKMSHEWASGPDKEGYILLPDYSEGKKRGNADFNQGKKPQSILGQQIIGNTEFQNLMVWRETFHPHQVRKIQVDYSIEIPPQMNTWKLERADGNYKGIWPQEANNLPLDFLKSIPSGERYYFFDYYLVSGASWKGVIGEEIIHLHLDKSWQGHKLYSNYTGKLPGPDSEKEKGAGDITYTYFLQNVEPEENLLFALRKP